MKISYILHRIISMNLELFYRKFQSIKLKLLYNNLLHLSVILNISNSLPSTAKLLHGIIKKNKHLRIKRVFDSIELRMLRIVGCLPTKTYRVTVQECCTFSYNLLSFSIRHSIESKTLFTSKDSVVL